MRSPCVQRAAEAREATFLVRVLMVLLPLMFGDKREIVVFRVSQIEDVVLEFLRQVEEAKWAGWNSVCNEQLVWCDSSNSAARPTSSMPSTAVIRSLCDVEVTLVGP